MLMRLVGESEIAALAPDPSVFEAAKSLAIATHWLHLGYSDTYLWGQYLGSDSTPYKIIIEWDTLAIKCTCPSRKLPCKHGLGLLYFQLKNKDLFSSGAPPEWVSEWITKRQHPSATDRKSTPSTAPSASPPSAALEKRFHSIQDGINELRVWLTDFMRSGLQSLPQKPPSFWEDMIRRLIDAKAPGLAAHLRKTANLSLGGENWETKILERLSWLFLLTEAWQNRDVLSYDLQMEITQLIGIAQNQEQLRAQPSLKDVWLIVTTVQTEEEGIILDKTWLIGQKTGRIAAFMQFYPRHLSSPDNFKAGTAFGGELVFYPGVENPRVLIKAREPQPAFFPAAPFQNLLEYFSARAHLLSKNPFAEYMPALIANLRLHKTDNRFILADSSQRYVYLLNMPASMTDVMAISGGNSFTAFITGHLEEASLLAFWNNATFFPLPGDTY